MWVTLPVNDNVAEFSFEIAKRATRLTAKIASISTSIVLRLLFINHTITKKKSNKLLLIVPMNVIPGRMAGDALLRFGVFELRQDDASLCRQSSPRSELLRASLLTNLRLRYFSAKNL